MQILLKLQKPSPKNTSAKPDNEKVHKKYLSSLYCGNILITPNNKATYKRRCRSMRLFHLHSAVKIQPFYPVFLLSESITKIFYYLFLWNLKE